jgi:thiamine phosphate synthase YjbQ (UPF0047 family)
MEIIKVRSREREELVEFTDEVRRRLKASALAKVCACSVSQHTTAAEPSRKRRPGRTARHASHALHARSPLTPQHGMNFAMQEEIRRTHITLPRRHKRHRSLHDGELLLRWQGIFSMRFGRRARAEDSLQVME